MTVVKYRQEGGPVLDIHLRPNEGGTPYIEIIPEEGALFGKTLSGGRRIDAVSLAWRGGFLALVGYAVDGGKRTHTRVDLCFGGKVIDVPDDEIRQAFLEQIGNINACLYACVEEVRKSRLPGSGIFPKLSP